MLPLSPEACSCGTTVRHFDANLNGNVIGDGWLVPHCVYTPMDNQYARSKEVYAESGAATVKVNPLSITCLAYTSNVDTPGAE